MVALGTTISLAASCTWIALLLLLAPRHSSALFQEDAGRLDFVISTPGHGPVRAAYVTVDGTAVVTSGGNHGGDDASCYIASRSTADGSLLWRRNVCSDGVLDVRGASQQDVVRVATTASASSGLIHTLDVANGILRTWKMESGALVWETQATASKEIWNYADEEGTEYVFAASSSSSSKALLLSARTGELVNNQKPRGKNPSLEATTNVAECPKANLQVKAEDEGRVSSVLTATVTGSASKGERRNIHWTDNAVGSDDRIVTVALVTCAEDRATFLVASERGITALVEFQIRADGGHFEHRVIWRAHEGLGQVQSALLLDSSHYVGDLDPDKSIELLSLSSRLHSQWRRLRDSFVGLWPKSRRDSNGASPRLGTFGFVKTAVLLTPYQVLGVSTVGPNRGRVAYSLNLPTAADGWTTRMIYTGSSTHELGSGHGHVGSHHRDVLAISTRGTSVQWMCFDGTSGAIHSNGQATLTATLVQIVPMPGAFPCRQAALLQLADGSIQTVPSTETASLAVTSHLRRDGIYTHSIINDDDGVRVSTASVTFENSEFNTQPIGSAFLPNEQVVRVAYPRRDDSVSSPYLAQGDDSILLKYLNPHLAVMVTMLRDGGTNDYNSTIAKALNAKTITGSGSKRKPVGATVGPVADGSAGDAASDPSPNLFVNVIDTVSGRVLYRVGHSNAQSEPRPTAIVSENWIFYSFANEKTRRAELGVASLYEGMIDPTGLTAFSSPELSTSFSSLDARESKPVVLAKTFSLPRPVAALGMTLTKGGISGRRLVVASVDGRVYTLDRKSLEPRRPVGPLKDSEKKEGLMQYSEFIPFIPYLTVSYNRTIEGVSHILAAPTDLESQTLVLAYGGPDVFFARTSPSRGFDLLPDNFNRVMLSVVVLGLVLFTGVLRKRVAQTMQRHGWV